MVPPALVTQLRCLPYSVWNLHLLRSRLTEACCATKILAFLWCHFCSSEVAVAIINKLADPANTIKCTHISNIQIREDQVYHVRTKSTSIFTKAHCTTCRRFQNRNSLQMVIEPARQFWNRSTGSGTV